MNRFVFNKCALVVLGLFVYLQASSAQRFTLFPPESKKDFHTIIYDFLETYLYETDSISENGGFVERRLMEDGIVFLTGSIQDVRKITPYTSFEIKRTDNKYYEISWRDSSNSIFIDIVFPISFELFTGKAKYELERTFINELLKERKFNLTKGKSQLIQAGDGCFMTSPSNFYYIESLINTTYFSITEKGDTIPTYNEMDKLHSAANLFHGIINQSSNYVIYFEQNLYGFEKIQYQVTLEQWLAYCQAYMLNVYFAIEEVRDDSMQALIIAQSPDLGFVHMLSIVIPNNFITNKSTIFKASLNAYIPTHNIKELYKIK